MPFLLHSDHTTRSFNHSIPFHLSKASGGWVKKLIKTLKRYLDRLDKVFDSQNLQNMRLGDVHLNLWEWVTLVITQKAPLSMTESFHLWNVSGSAKKALDCKKSVWGGGKTNCLLASRFSPWKTRKQRWCLCSSLMWVSHETWPTDNWWGNWLEWK